MFARRSKLSWIGRLRDLVWPRIGFRRSARYMGHRVARLPGSPHSIASGLAWGIAISFTPLLGLHIFLGALLAWLMRGSVVAAAIGTAVGNPWTFPFIWALIYAIGVTLLGLGSEAGPPIDSIKLLFNALWPLLGEWVQWLFGLKPAMEISSAEASQQALRITKFVLWPMLLGSLPVILVVWPASYFPLRGLIAGYQAARRRRWRRRGRAGAKASDASNIC